MSVVEIKGLTKRFGAITAVKDVNLRFEENRIYGLLGRNGAGKTTLFNVISNKIFPTSGEIYIDGENINNNDIALSKIYFMSQNNSYPDNMKMISAFKWAKEFYPSMNLDYAYRLAEKFMLPAKVRVSGLSTGYSSLYKIIIALSCNTPILLLDEPVLGLDAYFRDLFYRELLADFSERPKTIILSTHLIEEAADVIEDVIIIKNGQIILNDKTDNLSSKGYTVTGPARLIDSYISGKNVIGCDILGGIKSAYILEPFDKSQIPDGIEVSGMKMQNLFIYMTGYGMGVIR